MQGRLARMFLAATLLGSLPAATFARNASEFAKTLTSQKANFENRIDDLQRQVDDLFADKSYCSAEGRTEAYNKIRDLQRQITALRNEYGAFKLGAIKTAATPGYGPQLDAAGLHPEDRQYWADNDNALAKLRESALAKANRIEQAPYRDCSEKKSASPPQPLPSSPTPPKTTPEQPGTTGSPPAQSGGQKPASGCTDKEATDRRLRIQDEILRLEQELIPIDGTTPDGRARQLQLRGEIDRFARLLSLPCPPLLPPMERQPAQAKPGPSNLKSTEKFRPTKPETPPANSNKTHGMAPASKPATGQLANATTAKQEYDAISFGWAGMAVGFATSDGCDQQQLHRYIAGLEDLARRASALASLAKQAGEFSTVNASQVQKLAEHLQRHIDEAKQFDAVDCPAGVRFKMNPFDGSILAIHNQERAAVGVQPLHWDPILAAHAASYAQELARTGRLQHASREGRGIERENLGQGKIGWSPQQIVSNEWISEKTHFRAGIFPSVCDGDWSICAHYSQIIWPATTDIGCGYAVGGGFSWVVCRYSPGGNKDNQPVGYRDPSTYRDGPLQFNPGYSPVLKAYRPVNPDKLEFGDEAVAEWRNFENARGRCNVFGMSNAIEKLKYYAQAAHEHSAEERSKGQEIASGAYDAMAEQIDERVQDASLYRDACARNPYQPPERG